MSVAQVRIDHLAFPSFDVAATYHFYTHVMGFRLTSAFAGTSPEWGNQRYLMATFALGSAHVHFFAIAGMKRPRRDGLPKDIRHVALAVASRAALTAWKKRLDAHRVSYWVEDHDGAPSLYFSDPNDVLFEVTAHRPERFDRRAAAQGLAVLRRWGSKV